MRTTDFEIAGKSIPLRFGLDGRDRFPASEQEVVGLARHQQGFADRDTRSSGEICLRSILNDPTRLLEEEINLLASPLFWGHWAREAGSGTRKRLVSLRNRSFEGRNRIGILDEK
jgi:hypothetical protein